MKSETLLSSLALIITVVLTLWILNHDKPKAVHGYEDIEMQQSIGYEDAELN